MTPSSDIGIVVAAAVGLGTAALAVYRNKFLLTNILEMLHRAKHAVTGDNFDHIKASAERDPWFGKQGVAIVTGSNSGMGYCTALGLAKTGARVILAVRNQDRGDEAAEQIRQATGNKSVSVLLLDMNSVASVRAFAEAFRALKLPLHILIHNAGASGKEVSMNKDGMESTMALNFTNIVLLNSLLLPEIKATKRSRIIFVGSSAHYAGVRDVSLCLADRASPPISGWDLYGSAKLNVVAFAKLLARKLKSSGVNNIDVCSLDPGFVASPFYAKSTPFPVNMFGMVAGFVAKSPSTGAHSSLFAALSPTAPTAGAYLTDTLEASANAIATEHGFQDQLMEETLKKLKAAAPWWDCSWY